MTDRFYSINQINDSKKREYFPRRTMPSADVLDRVAEEYIRKNITGGYRKSDPICKICFCKINKAGSCNCT